MPFLTLPPQTGLWNAPVHSFEEIDSTNVWARTHGSQLPHGTLVWAEHQTGGYGRHQRIWRSPSHRNLYFSLVLKPHIPLHYWPALTQVAAIELGTWLDSIGVPAQVKWPNDILCESHKICGMISEVAGPTSQRYLVLGIGLNVNSSAIDFEGLDRKATSIALVLGQEQDRFLRFQQLLTVLQMGFESFLQQGFAPFLARWKGMRNFIGHRGKVVLHNRSEMGTIEDILDDGCLRFLCDNGETLHVYSGDLEI